MPDMFVKLLELPPLEPERERLRGAGVTIRRANPFEITPIQDFIREHFSRGWADEVTVAFHYKPTTIFIAIEKGAVIGFGAHECTQRGFFGPTGVAPEHRGRGIGRALLLACLWGMCDMGYVYGIIGGAGPTEFYAKAVGATVIEGSSPGIYADLLKRE